MTVKGNLGWANLLSGNLQDAEKYFTDIVQETSASSNINSRTASSYSGLARINKERENYQKALDYGYKALKILERTTNKRLFANAHFQLGNIFQAMDNHEEALVHLEAGLKYAREASSFDYERDILKLKIAVLKEMSNYEEAFLAQEKYLAVTDSLRKQSEVSRMDSLINSFQARNSSLQIELLENENRLQQAKIEKELLIRNGLIVLAILLGITAIFIYASYEKKKSLEKKLREKNTQLENLNEEKNMLFRIVSHDLKSPLSGILGAAEMLRDEVEDENSSIKELITAIESASFKMLHMVDKLLDLNKIESGNSVFELEEFNIYPTLEEVKNNFDKIAQKKNISIRLNFNQGELPVYADRDALYEILSNLVSNAVKFSPVDKNIFIKAYMKQDKTFIEVQDEGPGIPEEEMNKLFQKFSQLSNEPTGGENSTGLGLYIVKQLAEKMNGCIRCKSEKGKGANFILGLQNSYSLK